MMAFNWFPWSAKRHDSERGLMVSFPKSGRTWVRVMLDSVNCKLRCTHDGSDHSLGTHFNDLVPCQVDGSDLPLLFLHRDPRDTAVSGFFQRSLRISEGYDGSISDFVRDPHFGLEKILRFNLAWFSYCLDQESACSIRVLSYEALRRDPERGLSQLCSFLVPERKVGERQIQQVIAQTSFERMQAKEKAGAFAKKYSKALTPGDSSNVESFKVRRGKVGGFADYFTGDDLSFADQLMARYDYNQALQKLSAVSLI